MEVPTALASLVLSRPLRLVCIGAARLWGWQLGVLGPLVGGRGAAPDFPAAARLRRSATAPAKCSRSGRDVDQVFLMAHEAAAWRRWVLDADRPSLDAYLAECCA